jgi:2-C-methyl-D-erythritol 2,4-cyclodiphosphate synthase
VTLRIGQGIDVHRLVPGRPLMLGGVRIPFDRGPEGHSDADVLCHALADALLGAAGCGDIGVHFPPGDPQWKDIPGPELLVRARRIALGDSGRVVNADATVMAEAPRIGPHAEAMRLVLAEALACPLEAVSVKATTTEGLGPVGRGEAIAAQGIVLVEVVGGSLP